MEYGMLVLLIERKGERYRMKYTREDVIARYNAGEPLEILPFWGHRPNARKITKACFSQWFDCRFTVDGVEYHTAEQYMMAQKAQLMGDPDTYQKILAAQEPKEYKSLGRNVQHFDPKLWDMAKYAVVLKGNLAKFSQNPAFREFLDSTGDSVIVEASPFDAIWGVKLRLGNPALLDPNQWQGQNLLGFALMETRDILRERKQKEQVPQG